jgi:predicted RNase H-like HicB family nuclease
MLVGTFTAVLHKGGDLYVADCPEVGTVSQGKTVEEAIANLKEATELYLEEFPPDGSSRPIITGGPEKRKSTHSNQPLR